MIDQKTYCAIEESGQEELDNPIVTVKAITSALENTNTASSFYCGSSETLARINAAAVTEDHRIWTIWSILDVCNKRYPTRYLCNEAVSNNGILTVSFPVMVENTATVGGESRYSNACTYIISRNESDTTYTTTYQTQKLGFLSALKSFAGSNSVLRTVFEIKINAMDTAHPYLNVSSASASTEETITVTLTSKTCTESVCTQRWSLTGLAAYTEGLTEDWDQ